MKRLLKYILAFALATGLQTGLNERVDAQSNDFRDTRAHLGIAGGLFTFHGPIDLNRGRSRLNFVREHDPALVVLGSFPIFSDKFFFRGMVLFTNFSTQDGRDLVGDGQNAFLTEQVLIFEPELVWTLRPGSKSRVMPYVFTGFGGTVADAFDSSSRNQTDLPGRGVPGPERSVYHLPVGFGVDVAFNGCHSMFGEVSYRWDMNYVWRNESDYNKHNTSLAMLGVRTCLRNPFKAKPPPPPPAPPPLFVPAYDPPLPKMPRVCTLVELNSVFFDYNSVELSEDARTKLDQNIEALQVNPTCCVEIVGTTDRQDSELQALRLANRRAEVVYRYYLSAGLSDVKFTLDAVGSERQCEKGKDGKGCEMNRRVDSLPFDCSTLLDY